MFLGSFPLPFFVYLHASPIALQFFQPSNNTFSLFPKFLFNYSSILQLLILQLIFYITTPFPYSNSYPYSKFPLHSILRLKQRKMIHKLSIKMNKKGTSKRNQKK